MSGHPRAQNLIATPTQVIRIKRPSAAPTGIDWTRLSAKDLEEMPILAELKRMTTSIAQMRWCRVEDTAFRCARPSTDLTAAPLIWLVTCSAANGQTGPGGADILIGDPACE